MATLKQLVDETTNIKNDIVTCHTNLKNNLTEKGVECSDTDKMPILIEKIKNLRSEPEMIEGSKVTLLNDTTIYGSYYNSTPTYHTRYYVKYNGEVTINITHYKEFTTGFEGTGYAIVDVLRGTEVILTQKFLSSATKKLETFTISGLKVNDVIRFATHSTSSVQTKQCLSPIKMTCDFI